MSKQLYSLLVCGQNIRELSLGIAKDDALIKTETMAVPPEQHLQTIVQFLASEQLDLDKLDRLYVVTGPGSFTASRVSVTIVNTIAVVRVLPVHAIENADKQSLEDLWEKWQQVPSQKSVIPTYDQPPNITTPKK